MEGRPDPDALLRQVEREEQALAQQRGKLKIFFGYAAGVGKTYAMLKAAHQARKEGDDVVIGYLEPHARPETAALAENLPRLPMREIRHKGIVLHELDLDAALSRNPDILLVDELAHTNAEGSRHEKRYQDVKELLRHGIDVYTTVNVQHLESLNDLVASITGVMVRERVPDSIFDEADQVELVDIEPEELLERLKAGKIYRERQARRAMDHFFTVQNLAALREIALRKAADRVNHAAQKSADPGKAPAPIAEHILIGLSAAPSNPRVIRTAARLCEAFHGRFTALYVMNTAAKAQDAKTQQRLRDNMRLAEQLGARIVTVYGEDIPQQMAEYASVSGVTKIVVGRTNTRTSFLRGRRSFVDRLNALTPDIDVYIIPDAEARPGYRSPCRRTAFTDERLSLRSAALALAILVITTALSVLSMRLGFHEVFVVILYVFGILLTAVTTGNRLLGLAMTAVSVLTYNYFFTEPYYTLMVSDPGYIMAFLLMTVITLLAGDMARRVRRQARQEAQKAHRTEVLLQASQKFQQITDEEALLSQAAGELVALLGRSVIIYPARDTLGKPVFVPSKDDAHGMDFYTTPDEYAVAAWALKNRKHAGATTGTLPGAKCLYLTARSQTQVQAVVGISMTNCGELESFEKNLLLTLMDLVSLAVERIRLTQTRNQAQLEAEQARLRANLLRMISHDLRTPLTSISGNAEILLSEEDRITPEKKRTLVQYIRRDAQWLTDLVENLLAMTKMENGTASLQLQPEMVRDVVDMALEHIGARIGDRTLHVEMEDEFLMANMDAHLMTQVITNLIDNAIKYTPAGSSIDVKAYAVQNRVRIEVADEGPGIPDTEKKRIFDMFYTGNNEHGDGRRGIGLGLSLCKTIVQAHGGSLSVRDRTPHGSVFCIELAREALTDKPEGENPA